ncbi:MAG TPA: hypothetical protein VFA46_03155 [Actinomycetes bacterium]|nr:hypothetical protein [Actinomycetes bacterium]
MRVANLPELSTGDLEPDDPAAFDSFEVDNPQGLAHIGGDRWILSSESTVRACRIEAADPFRPTGVVHVTRSLGNDPWNNHIYVYSGLTGRPFGASREWDFNGLDDEIEGIDVHPAGILFRFRSLAPDQV